MKKELLVAMQAIGILLATSIKRKSYYFIDDTSLSMIDELFNANQVNLQLLAVTPALFAIFALQIVFKTLVAAIRSTSRGKVVESGDLALNSSLSWLS